MGLITGVEWETLFFHESFFLFLNDEWPAPLKAGRHLPMRPHGRGHGFLTFLQEGSGVGKNQTKKQSTGENQMLLIFFW